MKFLFTAGGTAGHINPALAVASRLRELLPSCEIMFIGADDRMEMELVPLEGYDIKGVHITDISRDKNVGGLVHNMKTAVNVLTSTLAAKKIIRKFSPDVVIGTGGYVCFPVIVAADSLGIPCVIHESNASPGLTTKLLSNHVEKILVGLKGCANYYPYPEKVVVTGTPVRSSFSKYTKESARKELGIEQGEKLVVSLWGSLGAGYMNGIVAEMLPKIIEDGSFRFIHATGNAYYESFISKTSELSDRFGNRIEIRDYIHDTPRVMAAADLIICRAGASTLSELAYISKPAILVPSPNVTENHQEKNARVLEMAGGAKVMIEGSISAEKLYNEIVKIINSPETCAAMAEGMAGASTTDATETIAKIIIDLCKE